MKPFSCLLVAALVGVASARVTSRRLAAFEFLGEDLDPQVVTFPLQECQGACLKDAHVSDETVGLRLAGPSMDFLIKPVNSVCYP